MGDFLQNSWLALLLTAAAAYLLGSVNSAIIVTKLFARQDIRAYGSGNAGATNVLRLSGQAARPPDHGGGSGQELCRGAAGRASC